MTEGKKQEQKQEDFGNQLKKKKTMAHYNKVEGTKFFKDENGTLHEIVEGEIKPADTDSDGDGSDNQIDVSDIDDEFGMDFLSDRFKEGDKKVESGEISCNLDNPEDCEACGS